MNNKMLYLIIVAVLLLNIFAVNTAFGVGVAIFLAVFDFILMAYFLTNTTTYLHKKIITIFLAITSFFLMILTSFTANDFICTLFCYFYFLSLYLMILVNGLKFYEHNLLWWLGQALSALPTLFLLKKKEKVINTPEISELSDRNQRIKSQVRQGAVTFLVAMVVLSIFGALLAEADPLFAEIISRLLDTLLERLLASSLLIGAMIIIFLFSYQPQTHDSPLTRQLSDTTVLVTIGSLLMLFTLFLFTQLQYLFASEKVFAELDITYSDYVRQGFVQLLWVGALGFIVSYFVHHMQRPQPKPVLQTALKIVNLLLIGELFAILLSAANRNWLYVSAYGLSRIRLVGMFFLVWLAIVFIFHFFTILSKRLSNKIFFFGFFVSGYLMLALLGLIKMDRQIVSYNLSHTTNPTDYQYLSLLSEEITDVWYQQLSKMSEEVNQIEKRVMSGSETDGDLKRLAEIKVAVFTIDNTLNKLIIKYGSEQSALKSACVVENGYSFYDRDRLQECLLRVEGFENEELEQKIIEFHSTDEFYRKINPYTSDESESVNSDGSFTMKLTDDMVTSLLDQYQYERKWQAANLAERSAFNYYLANDGTAPTQFFAFYQRIMKIQIRHDLSLRSQIRRRESEYSSPLVDQKAYYNSSSNEIFVD